MCAAWVISWRFAARAWLHGKLLVLVGLLLVAMVWSGELAAASSGQPGTTHGDPPPAAQVAPRQQPALSSAFRVAVFSEISGFDPVAVANVLNTDPQIVAVPVDRDTVASGLAGYDVLLLRFGGDTPTVPMRSGVRKFVSGGGGVVADWWGAGALLSGVAPAPTNYFVPERSVFLFAGAASGGDFIRSNYPVLITHLHPVTMGLSRILRAEDASEFFVQSIPPRDLGLSTIATYLFNGEVYPAIAVGEVQSARVALIFFDAADRPDIPNIERLLFNSVYWAAS